MDKKFTYTYSAPTPTEREEIEGIRNGYVEKEPTDLERLRELDKRVKKPPMVISLTLGTVGTMLFGLGMAMALEWQILVWGIVIGTVGAAVAGIAYPVYRFSLNRRKKKYGGEILAISDRLLNENKDE